MTPVEKVIDALQNRGLKVTKTGGQWMGQCPSHEDRKPSLAIGEGTDKALLHCQAGCSTENVIAALGLTMSDLFVEKPTTARRIETTYDYTDEAGKILFQTVRLDPKDFKQRRPNGKGWTWNLDGTRRVLYKLPELLAAIGTVYLVEGEKDADRLIALGLTATCNPMGAGKWREEYVDSLRHLKVIVIADRDKAGRAHAATVADSLTRAGITVEVVEPATGNDVSDHLAAGHSIEELVAINPNSDDVDRQGLPESTWRRVDIAAFLAGSHTEDKPSILRRSDGVPLLYRGRVHSLYGEPEGLKTFTALEACRQELEDGNIVVYIDFEDSVRGIIGRLRDLGISDEVLVSRFVYIRPAERLNDAAREELNRLLPTATLVVIDGLTEALVLEGLNLLDNNDIAVFFERLPRPAARLGPAVLTLDHVGRDKEARGRYAIGAQAKLAGIDGAAYSINVTKPFGRGMVGQADIRLTKDRLGYVSEHAEDEHRTIATVEAVSDYETVTITLKPPGEFIPTILMEKVADALLANPRMSQKQIRTNVSGNTNWKLKALHQLVARGYVTTEPGPRGAILHTLIHPYRDGDELRPYQNAAPTDKPKDDLSPPVPDLSPGQVKVSSRPVPPYSIGTGRGLSKDMTFPTDTEDRSGGVPDAPQAEVETDNDLDLDDDYFEPDVGDLDYDPDDLAGFEEVETW